MTAGSDSFCAVLTSGGVDCWGYDYAGQNGDGTFVTSGDPVTFTPTAVVGVGGTGLLSGATNLASDGYYAFCATVTGGGLDCWGWGSGRRAWQRSQLSGVTAVTAGVMNYCATLGSGGLECWGQGNDGQLGNGILYNEGPAGDATPSQVLGGVNGPYLNGVQQVSMAIESGNNTFCALFGSASQVACWGYGNDGELGDGNVNPQGNATPVDVVFS